MSEDADRVPEKKSNEVKATAKEAASVDAPREDVPRADEPEYVKKMTPDEKKAYLYGKLQSNRENAQAKARRGNLSGDVKQRDDDRAVASEWRGTQETIERQGDRQREPAMIEAEAVAKMAKAMHHPDRMEALLHSHIPEKILSNMGELEAIERDAKSLYIGQVEDLVAMEGRVTRAMLELKIVDDDQRWSKDEFLDIIDTLGDADRRDVEDYARLSLEDFERQAELVDENWLWLEGIMKGVDDAFELALSASDKGRAEHAVKNIASMVQGSRNQPNFEDEEARSLWRRFKERFSTGH